MRALRWLSPLVLLLVSFDALARAGGGEFFSGDSDSDSGDIGFLLDVLWFMVRLTIEFPRFMLPVWAVAIVGGLIWWRFNASATTKRGLRGADRARLRPEPRATSELDRLRARDPGFDVGAFDLRTRKIFVDLQEHWFRRQLDVVRAFMSDGLHRRFVTLQRLMQAEGRRDALAYPFVQRVEILRVEHSEAFDAITVLVDAALHDTEVPADTSDDDARKAAQKARRERFEEVWTFVRRPDRRTKAEWDVSQGACPNCGAPFTGGAANKCEHCGAIVNSGAYDWVLSSITQVEAYVPHRRRTAGLEKLRARDPAICAEILEDRAQLVFWKWIEASALGDAAVLRKVSAPEAFTRFARELSGDIHGQPRLRLPAVGGAEVIGIEQADGLDRVHVDVRWSAAQPGGNARPHPRRHVVTLVRASTPEADVGSGLSTDRCGACGAPATDSDVTTCEYCGADFTRPERSWLLESVVAYERWQGASAPDVPTAPALAAPSERERVLRLMVALARADGEIDRRENALLRSCAKRWNVPWSAVEDVLEGDAFTELVPGNEARARETLQMLVDVAKIDGRIDARERALIDRAAAHLHITPSEVARLVA